MIRILKTTLKINLYSDVNAVIYNLRKLPLFRNILSYKAYKNKLLKNIVGILAFIYNVFKFTIFRLLYFIIIYFVNLYLFKGSTNTFMYVFIIFCLIGLFINNKLLLTDDKRYNFLEVFNFDQKKFFQSQLFYLLFINVIFFFFCLFIFKYVFNIPINIIGLLIICNVFTRIIGEAFNISFYLKHDYIWLENTKLYFTILITLLLICLLPLIGYNFTITHLLIISCVLFIMQIFALRYLLKFDKYKLVYKQLYERNKVTNKDDNNSYIRKTLTVKDKDIKIDNKKLEGLKSYDRFNKIFFERHKDLLLRSARNYSLVIGILLIILNILTFRYTDIKEYTNNFLSNHIAWFLLIMYFVNRGSVITQAMFYNCDHAMLKYNFYREPIVILNLFKKRIKTVVRVNLLPAITMVVGISLLLIQNHFNVLNIIMVSLFILLISVFFSVHYLVIYYLLQPYNEKMQVKKVTYNLAAAGVYIIAYTLRKVVTTPLIFSSVGLVITIIYIVLSLLLVYKYAYKTFKLN